MFQDIGSHRLHNEYGQRPARSGDRLLSLRGTELLLRRPGGAGPLLPTVDGLLLQAGGAERLQYLLTLDDTAYFYDAREADEDEGFQYQKLLALRERRGDEESFAAATAAHLAAWYRQNRFCGVCGTPLIPKRDERALVCPRCGQERYPAIAPVVIVGVTHRDRLLLTRYAGARGYRRHALVAGFVEVGESLETAIEREVYEEAGLRVKNFRYFASQPWAFSQSLLMGFFCEAVDPAIHLNTDGKEELSEAVWVPREEIEPEDGAFSLTWTMIRAFADGKVSSSKSAHE